MSSRNLIQSGVLDTAGRIVDTAEMVAGVSTKWSYADGKGTRTRVRMGYPGADVDVSYSDKGEEISRVASAGVSCTRTVTARDDARRAIGWTLTTPAGALSSVATYTADGKLVSASGAGYKDRSGALYTFTSTGRPASSDIDLAYNGAHVREDYEYGTYGYGTNRLTRAVTNGVTRTYGYDWGGRIAYLGTGPTGYDGPGVKLSYDSLGRLSSARDLFALPNASAATTYRYDERGRRISESRAAPSRPTTTTTYSWDGSDRLVTWRRAVGGASVATASFSYDASGQRTRSVLTTPGGISETSWVYEGLTLLSVSTTDSVGTVAISYLYDETSRPYALAATLNTATPVLIGLVTTARGDVVEMIDEAGGALSYWRYDVWGNPTASATQGNRAVAARIAAVQPLRYAGYTYDAFSGLYYCSQRYYDPATCQFISKDPARADGEESAYQYSGGDPVGKVDPSGRYTIPNLWVPPVSYAWTDESWGYWSCGTAAMSVVISYILAPKRVTDDELYRRYAPEKHALARREINTDRGFIKKHLHDDWRIACDKNSYTMRWSSIRTKINSNNPIMAFFGGWGPKGHVVVIVGYGYTKRAGKQVEAVQYFDSFGLAQDGAPPVNHLRWASLDEFKNKNNKRYFPVDSTYKLRWVNSLCSFRKARL